MKEYKVKYSGRLFRVQLKNEEEDLYRLYQTAFNLLVDKSNGAVITSYELARPDGSCIIDEALDKKISEEPIDHFVLRIVPREEEGLLSLASPSTTLPVMDNEKIEKRIGQLLACNGADLNPDGRSSNILMPILSDRDSFFGFSFVEHLSNMVWGALKGRLEANTISVPKADDDEEIVIHPFIQSLFNVITSCASMLEMSTNRLFYEYDASDEYGKTSDWVMTGPREQQVSPWNKLLFIEAKQIQTSRKSGSRKGNVAKSEDVLMRDGMEELLHHIVRRYNDTDRTATHGLGLMLNGRCLRLIRVDFRIGNTSVFPVYISNMHALFDNLGSETPPLAIQWMCALLVEPNPVLFGLPRYEDKIKLPPEYQILSMLGEGGFGLVYEVARKMETSDEKYAMKVARHGEADWLQQESLILQQLNECNVPRVPRLHRLNISSCLWMTPVGEPFITYSKHLEPDKRNQIVTSVLLKLYETLSAAHHSNILHGDIRPNNVVMVNEEPYLIDWGLGSISPNTKLYRSHLFGVKECMATDKLRLTLEQPSAQWLPTKEHDLQALLYTYVAMLNCDCQVPWGAEVCPTVENMIQARRNWFEDNKGLFVFAKDTPGLFAEVEKIVSGD